MIMRGFAALFVIVVLGAASLIMAVGSAFAGLGAAETAFIIHRGNKAFSIADGCVEYALLRLRSNASYNGFSPPPPLFSDGSCTISVVSAGPGAKSIEVSAVSGDYHKKIRVDANEQFNSVYGNNSDNMNEVFVAGWREVSD